MNVIKRKTFLFFVIPILAILACNAPIEELFPAETPTALRPTIGPPPTLTPISLDNSEFVIITNTPRPTATDTPVVETPAPELLVTPSATPTLIPTVTQNPDFADSQLSPTVNLTPLPEIEVTYLIEWENGRELQEQLTYAGSITLDTSGGSERFIVFLDGLQLESNVFNLTINNCNTLVFDVVVQSADTAQFKDQLIVEGPCLGVEEIENISEP